MRAEGGDIQVMSVASRTHYDVLGLSRDADAEEVRRAWKVHVQVWHPDRFDGQMREEAERQAARINEAYTVLRDSSRRAAYDCRLAADELNAKSDAVPASQRAPRPAFADAARRHSVAPAPMAPPPPAPATLADQMREIGSDLGLAMRRHPRVVLVAATSLAVVFGGSAVMHVVTGPSLPAGTAQAASVAPTVARVTDEGAPDVEDLTEDMRSEAERAQRELDALMAQDAAAEQAAPVEPAPPEPQGAPRAGDALAPDLPAQKAAPQPKVQEIAKPGGGKILRVLPARG